MAIKGKGLNRELEGHFDTIFRTTQQMKAVQKPELTEEEQAARQLLADDHTQRLKRITQELKPVIESQAALLETASATFELNVKSREGFPLLQKRFELEYEDLLKKYGQIENFPEELQNAVRNGFQYLEYRNEYEETLQRLQSFLEGETDSSIMKEITSHCENLISGIGMIARALNSQLHVIRRYQRGKNKK